MTAREGKPEDKVTGGSFHVRPRFKRNVNMSVASIETNITKALNRPDCPCTGSVIPGHATLRVPRAERQYWSPQLQLTFEEEEGGTLVRGLFGPRPQVWTMFVLFYSIIGFAALILLVVGMSFMTLGKGMALFWGFPLLALIFLSLYLVAYFGQKKSYHQMIKLHRFFEEVMKPDNNG